MEPDEILGFIVVATVVIIPALAFTARFALAPFLEARRKQVVPPGLEERLAALEGEVHDLREENAAVRGDVRALQKAEEFYRELQKPVQPAAPLPTGAAAETHG